MKLLIDANLSPRVARLLQKAGYEASHVRDHGLFSASDAQILSNAIKHKQVIVSADSDFASMLALSGFSSPSLILLRSADLFTPDQQAELLTANLPAVTEALIAGAVVSLRSHRLRVRLLPIR